MLLSHSFTVLFAVFPIFAISTPFLPRGNSAIAQNWNLTSLFLTTDVSTAYETAAPADISKVKPPRPLPILETGTGFSTVEDGPRPKPTDSGPSPSKGNVMNSTCGICTVNVPQANVNWWFGATFQYVVGTLTTVEANYNRTNATDYMSLIRESATFDVTQTINDGFYAYTSVPYYDDYYSESYYYVEPYTVIPSAASTSVVTRTAAFPLPSGDIVPITDYYLYDRSVADLSPPSVAITGPRGTVSVATSSTPFLYFSVYEVEAAVPVTLKNGAITHEAQTQTFSLNDTYAYPVGGKGPANQPTVIGEVPAQFMQQIPQSACCAGSYTATVIVLVVVDLTYLRNIFPNGSPFLVHIESSVLGFETPPPPKVQQNTHKEPPPAPETQSRNAEPIPTSPQANAAAPKQTAVDSKTEPGEPTSPDEPSDAGRAHPEVTVLPSPPSDNNAGGNNAPAIAAPEPTKQNVGTVGSVPINVGPSSVVVVGSQTLIPGSPALIVDGTPVSLVPSATAIVIGGTTSALPRITLDSPPPPLLTIGSSTFTGNAATQFLVAPGQTLTPGGTVTVGGTVVSLAPSASFLVVGGNTQALPAAAPGITAAPQIVVGGNTITANLKGSTFIISGQTLAPDRAITVSGTTISLPPAFTNVVINGATQPIAFLINGQMLTPGQAATLSGTTLSLPTAPTNIVINGITQPLSLGPLPTSPPVLTLGNTPITANSGPSFLINGQTLIPGGTITVSGTTVALGPAAAFVVVNGATSTFPSNPSVVAANAPITPPPLTIGNGVFTALSGGAGPTYIIGGETLTPGGTITVAGSTISLAAGASALVVNGKTTTLLVPATITNPPLLTIGSRTITALGGGGTTYIISRATLTPGGVITVDGTTVSLAPGATLLVYGSAGGERTTETLFPATVASTGSTSQTGTGTGSGASAGATGTDARQAEETKKSGAGAFHGRPSGTWAVWIVLAVLGLLVV